MLLPMGSWYEKVKYKVICLDDTFNDNLNYLRKIKVNDILTCEGIQKYDTGNTYYVLSSDLKNPYHVLGQDFEIHFKSLAIMREEKINNIFND
jgi:hypothetical protein